MLNNMVPDGQSIGRIQGMFGYYHMYHSPLNPLMKVKAHEVSFS
jgi:hypothetical protein